MLNQQWPHPAPVDLEFYLECNKRLWVRRWRRGSRVEHLTSQYKTLSSNLSPAKKKKRP
jgi:hypothetical protein